MPSASLDFRAICGSFVFTYTGFMYRRAKYRLTMIVRVLTASSRLKGVMVGLILTVFFTGDLLLRCGDVERNPGPKSDNMRQTRLNSGNRIDTTPTAAPRNDAAGTETEPTLKDVMSLLMSMNSKFDDMKTDMNEMKESYNILKTEVQNMKEVMSELAEENNDLKTQLHDLARKTDDLECRSKRNNLIFCGIPRATNETSQDCEGIVRDLITDKLELADDIEFDRVHRLSGKPNSPVVARCCFYKHKEKIMKERSKLKGSSIFIGEEFSPRVREIRKALTPHLKTARNPGKRATMVYDHLLIDGKKFILDKDNELKEFSCA